MSVFMLRQVAQSDPTGMMDEHLDAVDAEIDALEARVADLEAETELQKRHISALQAAITTRKTSLKKAEARVAELEAAPITTVFVVLPHLDYEGYGAPLSAHTTREAAWLAAAAIKKQGNDKYTKYEVEEVALAAMKGDEA